MTLAIPSAVTAVGTPLAIVANPGIPHGFVYVEFYTSSAGTTAATPTAGTVAAVGRLAGTRLVAPALDASPITAATPTAMSYSGPVDLVTVTPSSVSGNSVTHYRAWLVQYNS